LFNALSRFGRCGLFYASFLATISSSHGRFDGFGALVFGLLLFAGKD